MQSGNKKDIILTYNQIMLRIDHLGELSTARIVRTWWPLAASWMLMGAELPALSAVMARLPYPEINLQPTVHCFSDRLIIELPSSCCWQLDRLESGSYKSCAATMVRQSCRPAHPDRFHPLYYCVVEKIIGAPGDRRAGPVGLADDLTGRCLPALQAGV
jgi:hypothetical protein